MRTTGSHSTLTKIVTSLDRIFEVNDNLSTPCLPQWAAKTIEAIGPDVSDITISRHTCS